MALIFPIATAALFLAATPASAAPAEEHVRGTVAAVAADTVTVKGADGRTERLRLGRDTGVRFLTRADLGALTTGQFIGTTAVQARDGTLRAVEVHVFPEAMRGTGEGHRPWDLKPGSTMTNARVADVEASGPGAQSTMTNANVSGVAEAAGGKRLTLSYAGGQKTVLVPPGTPVVRVEPTDRSALTVGQHVFAAGSRQPDGTLLAGRIFVGKGGVVPPM